MTRNIDHITAVKRQAEFKAIMKKHGHTHTFVAKMLNKSRHQIDRYCRAIRDEPRSGYVPIPEDTLYKYKVFTDEISPEDLKGELT